MQTDLATRLEELAGRVTPGPWRATGLPYNGLDDPVIVGGPSETYVCQTVYDMQSMTTEHDVHADTELIALLGSHLPDIIAALRAGEKMREALVLTRDLLECVEQTKSNVWWVNADDPEEAVCSVHGAVEDALALPAPPAKETPTND